MNIKIRKLLFLFAIVALASCSHSNIYEDAALWYDNGKIIDSNKADVFYVLPTCGFDWTDSLGTLHRYASLTDEKQRAAMLPSYQLADDIFADSANFFAPYYRYISLNVWMEGEAAVDSLFPAAMRDVNDAFDYYLKHKNNGRPFILAGFSQGAKCVIELLKAMDNKTAARMIAAYACGYRLTASDMAVPSVRCATGADDTGAIIAYNSVIDTAVICPVLTDGNQYVINPASWTTDTATHMLNDSVSVTIEPSRHVLLVNGVDPMQVYTPSLSSIFKPGNLHLMELTLYHDALQRNAKQRIKAYTAKHKR